MKEKPNKLTKLLKVQLKALNKYIQLQKLYKKTLKNI